MDRRAGSRHTRIVLRAVPGRDWLRAAVARAARYARLSPPIPAGPHGREFLWQADASDDKLKLMLRRGKGAPLETVLDPNTWASDEALVFAVPSPDGSAGRVREGRWQHPRRGDPRARRRDRAAASRPAPRHEPRVAGLAARRVGVFLCGVSRAGRGARGRRGALERHLRAPARVGRAGPPGLRRRPGEGVLVLRQGQRVRPLRRALQVGLCARQRRLPAAPRRRRARAGGSRPCGRSTRCR